MQIQNEVKNKIVFTELVIVSSLYKYIILKL
jgi:hypothetical protein